MDGEEFKTLLTKFILDAILLTVDIHIYNLSYLENKFTHFPELVNGGTKELNRILVDLDGFAIIRDNDDKHLLVLINLEVE